MNASIHATMVDEWPALRMCNDQLALTVSPALGGKITQLRSLTTGRDWLWSNPHLPQTDPTAQTDYVGRFDTGGWDEIFPTVDPCVLENTPWGAGRLTDHGEIWRRVAEVASMATDAEGAAALCLRTRGGESLPFTFERELKLWADEPRFRIEYRLANRAREPLPYLWATHPLLAVESGMRIELPDGINAVCTGGIGEDLPIMHRPFGWPAAPHLDGSATDFSVVPESAGYAVKLFTEPLEPGWITIVSEDSFESLRFDFDGALPLCVGMWLNYGGWSGSGSRPYFNVGLEPTTSPYDSLADAVSHGRAAIAAPNAWQQWHVTVTHNWESIR